MNPGLAPGFFFGKDVMSTVEPLTLRGAPNTGADSRRHLLGPKLDFFLLGGGSLIALLLVRIGFGGTENAQTTSLAVTLALANLINHPHFAHSYQIFYGDFWSKLRSRDYPDNLRLRYFLVGVIAPLAVAGFLWWTVWAAMPRMLGLAANAMFFLVGWHYVKQGYGIAMVDAVLKRAFYSDREKKRLLLNAYATWILSWLLINFLLHQSRATYFGIEYFVVPVPAALVWIAAALTALTTAMLAKELLSRKSPPAWNGLVAYAASIYAWLLIRDPVILLWVPLFHSLQYLAVVWRFQYNKIRSTRTKVLGQELSPPIRMCAFITCGGALGYAGFWLLPEWLGNNIPYDKAVFGSSLFFFLSWIFINIHHYLLDTVMWRKGNPDVSKHLFQQ